MKVYRNHRETEADGSTGYSWFATEAAAIKNAERAPEEFDGAGALIAEEVEFTPTKAGILKLLDAVASHANNG